MMYPFLTLDDETEIVHSEMKESGNVDVYIEKPDENDGFHHMYIHLPKYEIEDVVGFSEAEIKRYEEIIRSTAHLIMEFSQEGEFDNASGTPHQNATKIWITSAGKCLVANNRSDIPVQILKRIVRVIEARSAEVIQKWTDFFGEVHYYI